MKKILSIALAMLTLISIFSMTAFASNDKIAHKKTHALGPVTRIEATATAHGREHYECTVCSYVYDEVLHNYGSWVIVKEASCKTSGEKQRVCTVCNAVETAEIPAGHHYVSTIHKATCVEDGYTELTCTGCGDSYTYGVVACRGSHNFGKWILTQRTTCDTNGKNMRTCEDCGYVEFKESAAFGHEMNKDGVCKICGWNENEAIAVFALAEEHYYEMKIVAPTCTEDGYTIYTCADCGDVFIDEKVAATGHTDADNNNDCDACCASLGFKCTMCATYEANKDKPFIGLFYKFFHSIIHSMQATRA